MFIVADLVSLIKVFENKIQTDYIQKSTILH